MSRPEASWRRQLMTQPALADLRFWEIQDSYEINGTVRATSSKSLTLGDFAKGFSLRFSNRHEEWSWQTADWDCAPAVSTIEPARFATYTEGQWVASRVYSKLCDA